MPGSVHHSRHGSFGSSAAHQQQQQPQEASQQHPQQQGWHPQLPLHVPKRWSLELQRLGSFTSQLMPGSKSPTGQQQHSRVAPQQMRGHAMGHLPEEAPFPDAALSLLDGSLPVKLGHTHHTHIGVAVPVSSGNSSAASAACASGTFSFNPAKQEPDDGSKCTSIHEQMSQLAASLQLDASAPASLHAESTAATDEEASGGCFAAAAAWGATGLPQQPDHKDLLGNAAAARFGLGSRHQLLPSQRTSLDQHSLYSAQQQLQSPHAGGCSGGTRYSMESAYHPGYASPQQGTDQGAAMPQELSFDSMLAQHIKQQGGGGSSGNLKAGGMLSKSSSSTKLNPANAAAGMPGGIISLSPAATDCLVALGLASRLAGVTDACRVGQAASGGSAATGCQLAQLLHSMGAPWAAGTAKDEAACSASKIGSNGSSTDVSNIPVVCRLVEGPDGLPRYKLDEDHIRRVQPSLVLVACEENSDDEMHLQHYQQLKAAPTAGRTPNQSFKAPSNPGGGGVAHGSSTLNGAVAVPGRVRLQVAVVQRVLQRAGVLWPEQRAVVLYQRCHSLAEVFEFIVVLAQAAGVPERGVQLVDVLRSRLRAAAAKLCYTSEALSRHPSNCSSYSGRSSSSSRGSAEYVRESCPTVVVLESTNPLRLAGFWVPEMLQLAGAGKLATAPAAAEPPAATTWPLLKAAAPDILVIALPGLSAAESAVHVADLAVLPGFWSLPAVRSGAVYMCDHTLLLRPGPSIVVGVELLGHLVAPEKLQLPTGLAMGSVLKLSLHGGQRCRPRLVPNYMSRYC
eukprot:GHUV01002298.1.p1 GENE.GHUV01002298.1~~GHUV01002298.1.p1  ORF type:complete len:793 (+),score=291.96 GHUV01002298.1:1-2379(+)